MAMVRELRGRGPLVSVLLVTIAFDNLPAILFFTLAVDYLGEEKFRLFLLHSGDHRPCDGDPPDPFPLRDARKPQGRLHGGVPLLYGGLGPSLPAAREEGKAITKVLGVFEEGDIYLGLEAEDKWEAISKLTRFLCERQGINVKEEERFLQKVLERELSMTTGIGHGIALPHVTILTLCPNMI